ncbi:MAG: PAS domain-containing protein [Xanthomonadaceae bacterium]|nr:PAS domain-containing protein [Xanthomonadaceae bacterium]MDP2184155.1 PAS domain-containing protein [Xanthomonadales bacterium]MDZ4116459.1 PAS domain-containing protein [Xanthomonadaceae bacterium]MDZ4378275.1 PAS domain-containing protein [Xanthomonadaceae bacterium]
MTKRNMPSFESLLEDLYASVCDPDRFEQFTAKLRTVMNAHLVALLTDDASHYHHVLKNYADEPLAVRPAPPDDDGSINLYFTRGREQLIENGVLDSTPLFAPSELERSSFYQKQLLPIDVYWSMGYCLSDSNSDEVIALTVSRDKRRPPFEPEVMQLAQRLLPHLRNVYALQQRLQPLAGIATGLDCLSFGVWLLDHNGLVVHTNAEAKRLTHEAATGIHQHNRQLIPCWRPDRPALQHALAAATSGNTRRNAELLLHDPSGQAWASCTIRPLQRDILANWGCGNSCYAILFVQPLAHAQPPADALRHLFGLTAAETELACALVQHGALADCIPAMRKNRETLRSHLKALFAKTETHRQAELIRRLQAAVN